MKEQYPTKLLGVRTFEANGHTYNVLIVEPATIKGTIVPLDGGFIEKELVPYYTKNAGKKIMAKVRD